MEGKDLGKQRMHRVREDRFLAFKTCTRLPTVVISSKHSIRLEVSLICLKHINYFSTITIYSSFYLSSLFSMETGILKDNLSK